MNGPRRISKRSAARLARLRPRQVIANFRRWTLRELDLRREAASASELADAIGRCPDL